MVGISLSSLTQFPISYYVAAAVGVLLSLFPDRVRDLVTGKNRPMALLEPLQILQFGPGATLDRSQWFNMSWFSSGVGSGSLTALFGVIRVYAIGGDAIGCRASVRLKLQSIWIDNGNLNWYSPSLLRNLSSIQNFQLVNLGVYLANPTEHIPKDDSKDLLVFYMAQGNQGVYLCSDMLHAMAGNAQGSSSLQFQIELTVTAQNEQKVVAVFDVEASWGRFLVARVS